MTLASLRAYGLLGLKLMGEDGSLSLGFFVIGTLVCAVIAYLLGGLNFAIIISKIKYHDDIRKYGSGNAGMTNMMRTYGRAAGIFTLLGDLLKAVVAVLLTELLMGEVAAHIAGFACMLGHCFPCWYGFKGGKGLAVAAAMILSLEPVVFLVVFIVFVLIVLITRYISLGSIMGGLMYPIVLKAFYPHTHLPQYYSSLYFIIMICSVLTTLLLLFMHRENMKRLLAGKENKFSFKKKGTQNDKNINKD